ncbi:MAG: ribosome-binding factor A [Elusimicrobiota bacterium]
MERVNELLLQEISRFVLERQSPDMGLVTFTGVKVTEDLRQARVFYSVLGSDEQKAATAEILKGMRHDLVRGLRHLESLKYIPVFEFVYDETPEKASRVFELLEKIHEGEGEPPSPEQPPA